MPFAQKEFKVKKEIMPEPTEEEKKLALANKNIQTAQKSLLRKIKVTSASGNTAVVEAKPNQSGTGDVITRDGAFVGYAVKGGTPEEQELYRQVNQGVIQKGSPGYVNPKREKYLQLEPQLQI